MSSSSARHLAWTAGGVLSAAAALWTVATLHVSTPVDVALPLLILLLFCLGWIVRESPISSAIAAAAPLMIMFAAAVPDAVHRVALYGLTFAIALAAAAAASSTEFRLRLPEAIELLLVAIAAMRLIPFDGAALAEFFLIATGTVMLTVTFSRDGRVSLLRAAIVFGVAAATPFEPARASLFVLLVALVATTVRGATLPKLIATAVVAVAAGRWSLPIAVIPVIAAGLTVVVGERGAAIIAIPALVSGFSALGRGFSFAPAIARSAVRPEPLRLFSGVALLAATIFVRPPIGVLYALAALVILVAGEDSDSPEWSLPTVSIAFVIACLVGWGALPASTFPLPIDVRPLLVVALISVVAGLLSRWRISGVLFAAVFLALAGASIEKPRETRAIERALGPGESTAVHLGRPRTSVEVVLSGANISGLRPDARIATIELLDDRNHGYRRVVSVADAADWGAFRADQSFFTRNEFPLTPAGRIVGWGGNAYIFGAGRISISLGRPVSLVRIVADGALPKKCVVQVHAIEVPE